MKKELNSEIDNDSEFVTFTGEYEHTLDSQRRISIPTCWREKGKDNIFFLLPGRHGALQVIPYIAFKELLLKARKVSFADSAASLALARLGSMAQECKCDKQGRIPIPQRLLDYAKLGDVAVMVGALTSIQIWSPEEWLNYRAADENVLDEIQKISERSENGLGY